VSDVVAVDNAELQEVVRRLTGSRAVGWICDELHDPVASATVGIWRVHADRWSVVVKLIGQGDAGHPNWPTGEQADHWYYWRREALAYESPLLSSFAGGLRAPTCHLVAERSDGSVALWIEDLQSASPATVWPVTRYEQSARHLGRAQGEFAVGRSLPEEQWLSRRWLRAYLRRRDADIPLLRDDAAWATPLARRWLPDALAPPLLEMRRRQEAFLTALERTPQTVCHFDLHPANLFGRDDETILVDWSFVGIGAIGEDAGSLVPDSVLDFHVRPEHIDDLYEVVFKGYLAGLRDSGWTGSDEVLDLAMKAAIAAKYAWIAPAMLRAALDQRSALNRRPIEVAFAWWAPVIPFLVRCAGEAGHLVGPHA